MKKVYAFYQSIAQSNQPEEFACANYWKSSWENNGWETTMLNRSHAQASSLYNKLTQKVVGLSNGIKPEIATRLDWIIARYMRWCALHAAGGGWMTDYDVANKGFTPEIADEYEKDGTLHINANDPAYIIYATQDHCANAIRKFIQEPIIMDDKMRPESNILGVTSSLYPILMLMLHAKKSEDKSRSEAMKSYCE